MVFQKKKDKRRIFNTTKNPENLSQTLLNLKVETR